MPTLSSEESAFTLYIFVAFLLVTALLILAMSYYQDTYQKKRNSRGSRIRPAIPTVTKKSSADYDAVPTGLGVLIDFGCWLLQKISSIFSDVDNSESSSETSTYKNMVNAATELGSVVQDTLITAVSQLNSSKSNTSTSRKAPVSKKKIKASSSSPIPRIVAAKEVPLKSTVIADMTTTATCDKNEISVCKTASEEIGDTMKSAEESPHPMEESAFSTKESLHALQIKSDEPLQQLEERKSVSLPLTDMNDYGVGDAPTSAVEMLDLQRALELSKVDTGLSDQASDGGGWRSVEKDGRKKSKMKQQQSADKLPSKGTRSSGIQTPANSINDTRLSLHRQLKNSNKNTSTVAKKDIRGSELKHYGDQALKSVHNKVGLKNSADIAASTAYNSRKVSSASSSQLSNSPKNSTDSEQVGGSVYHNFANQQTMMENRIVSDLSSISVYQRTEGSPQSETVSGYGQINIPYQSMEGAIDDFAENGNVFLNLEPLLMSQDQLTFPMDSFDSNKLWNPLQPDNLFRDGSNFRDFLTGDFLLPSSLPNYSDTSLDEDFNQEFLNGVVNFLNLPGQGDSPEPFAFLNEANNSQSHRRLHEMDELGGGSLHQDSVRTAPNFAACESLQAPIVPSTQSSSNMDGMFGEESVPTAKEEQSSRLSRTEQLPSIELQATSFSSLSPNAPSFQPGGRSG